MLKATVSIEKQDLKLYCSIFKFSSVKNFTHFFPSGVDIVKPFSIQQN
jgi:hypothetical protein